MTTFYHQIHRKNSFLDISHIFTFFYLLEIRIRLCAANNFVFFYRRQNDFFDTHQVAIHSTIFFIHFIYFLTGNQCRASIETNFKTFNKKMEFKETTTNTFV